LITGETGTGKELAAKAIHAGSPRSDKPFLAINCGALPENLIESELFGHRKGAFTGADENRVGLFEVADGGTLFLDEIGELPRSMQAKLLRVLETGEVRRVGDNLPFTVDVRIVCATHRDLPKMVSRDEFREDLMYRINSFEIRVPPLRERTEDIPALANHLLARHRPGINSANPGMTSEALAALKNYSWPGNIRELANVIEHASILCDELPIDVHDLPSQLLKPQLKIANTDAVMTLRELEAHAIVASLERHSGNKTAASEELGISIKTLYNKLNQDILNRAA
jgi:two-component system NtrC family response regulator